MRVSANASSSPTKIKATLEIIFTANTDISMLFAFWRDMSMNIIKRFLLSVIYVFLLACLFVSILLIEFMDHHFFMSQQEMKVLELQTLVQMYVVPETLTPYRADIRFINNTYNRLVSTGQFFDGGPGGAFRLYARSGDGWKLLRNDMMWQLRGATQTFHNATPAHETDYEWLNPEIRSYFGRWSPRYIRASSFIDFDYHFGGLSPGEYRLVKQFVMVDDGLYGDFRFPDGERPGLVVVAGFTIP